MSQGRLEDTEGDFKEISLDSDNDTQQPGQDHLNSDQNLDVTEINQSFEHNRINSITKSSQSVHNDKPGKFESESSSSESTHFQSNLDSSAKNNDLQKLTYGHSLIDELQEARISDNTSRCLDDPNSSNLGKYSTTNENFGENTLKNSDDTEDESRDDEKASLGFEDIPIQEHFEPSVVRTDSQRLMEENLDEHLSEPNLCRDDKKTDTLAYDAAEYNLSDRQSPETLSEQPADMGLSEGDLPPKPELKAKHRKKNKSSKTFDSIFHKSSIGKSSKSSRSKVTTVPISPVSKDNLVVTTTTSSMTSTKKKDKSPSWTNYEIPSKPGRKGPTLGVFYDSFKPSKSYQKTESGKDHKCIVMQTPDSLERYLHPFQVVSNYYQSTNYIKYYNANVGDDDGLMNNYYFINMMAQRKSLLPYYVTKTIFGNVPGMGRVLVCGTQCGKVIFYSFFSLDELLVLDTRSVYDKYLSRDNSIDSESGCDMNKAIDSTLFEINCLSLIATFHDYSSTLSVGNHLGHLLLYQIPKLQLIKLIYPANLAATTSFTPNSSITALSSVNSYNTPSSCDSISTDTDEVLIDELELLKLRRHKNTVSTSRVDSEVAADLHDVLFISCLGYCSSTGDLWVGYGNGNFAIYSSNFKLKHFYNSNLLNEGNASTITLDRSVYSVNSFEFCNYEQIVLVLYGNVKLDIFTFDGVFLTTISATRLTNNTIPISTIHVSNTPNSSSILYVGLMDGSLLVKQIVYNTNAYSNGTSAAKDPKDSGERAEDRGLVELLTNNIEFILLYNLSYKIDGELNFGAPVTSICPVPSQNLVLLGNASGGLSVISNLDF